MEKTILNTLTVIIPVHTFDDEQDKELFKSSLNSIQDQKISPKEVIIVHTKKVESDIKTIIESYSELTFKTVLNEGESDFSSQVNLAVKEVSTEYFSILEFDDEYTPLWFNNVEKYLKKYSHVSVFLPLTKEATLDTNFIKFSNEVVFSKSISTENGMVTHQLLMQYPYFNITGGIFKKEDYEDIGGLKPSIKITNVFEYLLRATNQDQNVMVIPKLGYIHKYGRTNSLNSYYNSDKANLTQDEVKFWFDLAKKEMYFKIDRNIKYTVKN